MTAPALSPHRPETARSLITQLEPIRFDTPAVVPSTNVVADWKHGLPVFRSRRMMLRELVRSDAATLLALLRTDEVAQFISPPPPTAKGFETFIQREIDQRQAGHQMTFGMVPEGYDHAVGLIQVRAIAPNFSVAEWGFAVGSPFWGTGLFMASARTTIDFAFEHTALNRLEARAAVQNGRANGALRKLGAVQEGILRGSLLKDGRYLDQIMWSIVASDSYRSIPISDSTVH